MVEVYGGDNNWSSWSDVQYDFGTYNSPLPFAEPDKVLLARYDDPGYSGDAFIIFKNEGKLYLVEGSHCSCYGLEDQFDPEETTEEVLRMKVENTNYGMFNTYKNEILSALENS